MRLGTAIERLVDNYRYASDKDWIMDKVAWALYQTWKEADRNTDLQTETKTETQNSNLTFEKDECAKEYEELGLKELKELIEADRKTEPCDECVFVKGSGWCDNCNGKPKGLDALPNSRKAEQTEREGE